MTRIERNACVLLLALLVSAYFAATPVSVRASPGGGGSGGGVETQGSGRPQRKTPDQIAEDRYLRGHSHRDKALKYEDKATRSDKSLFGKAPSEKAVDQWKKAVKAYREAIEKRPRFYQAYSDKGYALRKLGDYEESIDAYDRALSIRPSYGPAIEYRGEAYLRLWRVYDAKRAYMRLFTLDRKLANQLMSRMTAWMAESQEPENGLSAEEMEAFRLWVKRRKDLASQAGDTLSDARSW